MKSQELLSQIKNLLGMEDIQLEKLNLENGTVLEAESFETGKEVFILSEDQKIPLPIGKYQLEDGRGLEVNEEGIISELNESYKEEEEVVEEEVEDKEEEEMEYVTREEFRKEMDDLKKSIEEMVHYKDKEKEEMASQVATEVAVEMSKTPATEPIKHSPEEEKTDVRFKFADNRKKSTLDRVMETIINK
jgi:oligoribonuclease (3'-5' exoribonuclease)